MSFVSKKFPSIDVKSINYAGETKEINLFEMARTENKKVLLFWYPKDFTYVCPTELHAFQEKLTAFEERNTIVIGASVDTAEVHFAWLGVEKKKGGIEGIKYPLISDSNRNLSRILDILDVNEYKYNEDQDFHLAKGDDVTHRATYLIDEEGMVFHESINFDSLGRNVDEYIRLIDAYSHSQKYGEVCPANWNKGEEAITTTTESVSDYLSTH